MNQQDGQSWRVEVDEPADLHQLLFVRDAFRLTDEPGDLGQLVTPAPDLSGDLDVAERPRALVAWERRWNDTLGHHLQTKPNNHDLAARLDRLPIRDDSLAGFSGDESLGRLLAASYAAFMTWWTPPFKPNATHTGFPLRVPGARGDLIALHLGRPVLHEVITEFGHKLGRRVLPFALSIEVIGLSSPDFSIRGEECALLSAGIMSDDDRYRSWLIELLAPLA